MLSRQRTSKQCVSLRRFSLDHLSFQQFVFVYFLMSFDCFDFSRFVQYVQLDSYSYLQYIIQCDLKHVPCCRHYLTGHSTEYIVHSTLSKSIDKFNYSNEYIYKICAGVGHVANSLPVSISFSPVDLYIGGGYGQHFISSYSYRFRAVKRDTRFLVRISFPFFILFCVRQSNLTKFFGVYDS